MPEAVYDEMFNLNAKGPLLAVQKLAPLINRGGAVVLTTSIANVKAMPGNATYGTAKAALPCGCCMTEPGGGAGDECDRMFHGRLRGEGGRSSREAWVGLRITDYWVIYLVRWPLSRRFNEMSQNAARPRGRPRSFDERYALEKAIQVFWSKGYDGVTIDDLVAGMGVGRPSLYAVFGDKRTLFLRVLRAYAETKGAGAAKALLSPTALRDSLASFLRHAVESATEEGSAVGCLLVCVAPLVDDPEVRQFLRNAAAGAAALVERRFRDGISAGEIPADFPVAARTSQVIDISKGLTMRAQMGTPRKTLLKDAEEAADLLVLPSRETSRGSSGSTRKAPTVRS